MNDLQVIKEIEKQIGVTMNQVSLEVFNKPKTYPERAYAIDIDNNIVGLWLDLTNLSNSGILYSLNSIRSLVIRWSPSSLTVAYSWIKELKNLTFLDLAENNINETSWIKELKNLTSLNLAENNITDVSWIMELKNLTSLNLWKNNITDASWIKELKNLTSLNLAENNITDVSWIKELKYLTSLNLARNSITDTSWIKELKNLTSLDLEGINIIDASWIKELKYLTSLNLARNSITDTSWIKELKNLTSLDLEGINIIDASWIKELKNLTYLNLSGTKLPDYSCIKGLKYLTSLNLASNNIIDASWIKELKNLTYLNLSGTKLPDYSWIIELKELTGLNLQEIMFPNYLWIKKLKNLTYLNLSRTKLPDYSWIKELKNLTHLNLWGNDITDASWIKELENLTRLNLWKNKITDTSWIKTLKKITFIDLWDNKITDTPEIRNLKSLAYLDLSDNPIQEPPKHIIDQGIEAIRSYFKQKEQQGEERLFEAKVLFVGEPGAGKTTLMKKLIDPAYKVPQPAEGSTLGIDIRQNWEFPHEPGPTGHFRAHLWDFGGQNIQYYIHQFFLTERSLYVLVTDDRKDNPNLDYWFNIIKLLGNQSPVVVVENRKNITGVSSLDNKKYENRYRESFRDLSFWDLNLSDKDDAKLTAVIRRIQETLCALPHIGESLPSGWVRVREVLQGLQKRNYINLSEYHKLCRDHLITGETDQMVLSGYLHDLGIILHFRKDTSLANIVFLNPQWLTKVMYIVLSDNKLREENAIFSKSWFMDRLAAEYSPDERTNILLLMQKEEFDLCYKLPHCDEEKYLIPHLLPDISPRQANEWQRIGCLNFRFTYAFMPIGIISRIIVRLNQWISQDEQSHPLVWKSGVILKRNESKALVVEEIATDGRRVIDICVCGPEYDSKELLGIIRGEIETLHRQSYKEIAVEQNVPCNCNVCKKLPNPTLFDAKRLMNHVKAGKREIDCEKIDEAKGITSFRSVSIRELLESVIDTRLPEDQSEIKKDRDPLNQIAQDLHKLPLAVEDLGKKVDLGLRGISDSVDQGVKNSTKKSIFQKVSTILSPFQLLGAIIVIAITIAITVRTCGQPKMVPPPQSPAKAQQISKITLKDTLPKPPHDANMKPGDSVVK